MPEQRLHNINAESFFENEGSSRFLGVGTVDLPELNFMTNEVKGFGINGTYQSPVIGHLEAMEATWHFRVLAKDSIKFLRQKDAFRITSYCAQQFYDAGTGILRVPNLKVSVRGLPKSLKLGKLEPGEQSETELTLSLDYIKIEWDGEVQTEIDIFNYICIVDKVDYYAEARKALGLA